jgi:hypothetical protein
LNDAIKTPKREYPFILKLGSAFHVIVDNQLFVSVTSASEALIVWLSVFYAFNISWNPKILPTFLFLQDVILENPDTASEKNIQVRYKLNNFKLITNRPKLCRNYPGEAV